MDCASFLFANNLLGAEFFIYCETKSLCSVKLLTKTGVECFRSRKENRNKYICLLVMTNTDLEFCLFDFV